MAHVCRALLIVWTVGWIGFLVGGLVVTPGLTVTGILVVAAAVLWNRPAPALSAHGTSRWASEADVRNSGLADAPTGLILGHLVENDDA
jgi:hypothetical protein